MVPRLARDLTAQSAQKLAFLSHARLYERILMKV